MALFDGIREMFSEAPEWKGHRFEKYVEERFSEKYFTLVERTHSYKTNERRYVESSLNPDFIWRYNPTNEEFAVEVKYRSRLSQDGMLQWSNPQQMERYKQFAGKRNIPFFIVVGLGGLDDDPNQMFVIPFKEARYPALYPSVFRQYERNPKSNFFWKDGVLK